MFNIHKLLAGALVGTLALSATLWWYLELQIDIKHTLQAEIKTKDRKIEEMDNLFEMYEKNKEVVTQVMIDVAKKQTAAEREANKLKIELRRLRENSSDICVNTNIPVEFINRLQESRSKK
jgi:hypothetical protein